MYKDINFQNIVAVTNRSLCNRPLEEQIKRICQLHPYGIILREKDLSEKDYQLLAEKILPICEKEQVPLLLHFFWETAIKMQVNKIHLPLWKLKEIPASQLSFFKEIGVSTHSPAEAVEAYTLGATYITAGHIFSTDCKKGLPPRGLPFLQKVCSSVSCPVYGIGGIHLDSQQVSTVLEQGAAKVCIMSEMMRI